MIRLKYITRTDCPFCHQFREPLKQRFADFKEMNIDTEEGLAEALFYDVRTVPSIVILADGESPFVYRGAEEIKKFLEAGQP